MAGTPSDNLVDVTIRVDPKASDEKLRAIARLLEERGLKRVVCHARFRIINGSVRAQDMTALGDVPGVLSVREDRVYGPR
jgi:hypothetical protein